MVREHSTSTEKHYLTYMAVLPTNESQILSNSGKSLELYPRSRLPVRCPRIPSLTMYPRYCPIHYNIYSISPCATRKPNYLSYDKHSIFPMAWSSRTGLIKILDGLKFLHINTRQTTATRSRSYERESYV